jgi:hypothetical protein
MITNCIHLWKNEFKNKILEQNKKNEFYVNFIFYFYFLK